MRLSFILAFLIVTLALSGCVSTPFPNERFLDAKPPNAELKKALLNTARNMLFDPGSIRDAEISNVFLFNEPRNLHAVCVKFNAKNRLGGYTGRTTFAIILNRNTPIDSAPNWYGCNHPLLKWQVFEEANGLASL